MNDLIFCTLFDSNYLDRGIALYNSILRVMDSFKLYLFAFDEKSEMFLWKNSLKMYIKKQEKKGLQTVENQR